MARKRFAPRPEPSRDLRSTDADRTFLQPAALKAWVASLPVAHPHRTAESLLEALQTVNSHRLRPRRHRGLLAVLDPATERAARLLAAPRTDGVGDTPLTEPGPALGLKLREEVIRSHRLVQRTAGPGGRHFRYASGRILHHAAASLEAYHCSHTEAPPGLWHLIHSQARSAPRGRRNPRYRKVLLAAAGNPWGLRREQIPTLYDYCHRLAGALRITEQPSRNGDIAFVPRGDAGPFPVAAGQTTPTGALFLEPRKVLRHLERESRRASKSQISAPETVQSVVRDRLTRQLTQARPRRHPRRRASGRVTVVSGLSAIHRTLTGSTGQTDPRAVFDAQARHRGDPAGDDVWNLILPSSELTRHFGPSEPQPAHPPPRRPSHESDWTLRDRSPNGYRLIHPDEQGGDVRVGRPLLLAEPKHSGERAAWELGVVRWLRHHRTGDVEVGISIVSPRVAGVTLMAETTSGARTAAFGGVITAAMPRLGIPETLVMPSLNINEGRPVWQQADSGEAPLQLISCLERGIDFTRYHIQRSGS